jgi:hypothetical protein
VTTCPVCGLEEERIDCRAIDLQPTDPVYGVSHLACVENIYTANLSLRVRVQQANREAAFWKWLWRQDTYPQVFDPIRIAHMRERFEEELP